MLRACVGALEGSERDYMFRVQGLGGVVGECIGIVRGRHRHCIRVCVYIYEPLDSSSFNSTSVFFPIKFSVIPTPHIPPCNPLKGTEGSKVSVSSSILFSVGFSIKPKKKPGSSCCLWFA